jgi:hypothetical protein
MVGLAAAARPRPSLGRGRRGGRDDMRVPPVSGSGEGARAGGGLGQKASWACGAALGCCARRAARPARLLASWACCGAGVERAGKLDGLG